MQAEAAIPYFQRPWVVGIVLGTFVVYTAPMALASLLLPPLPGNLPRLYAWSLVFFVVFGLTHFLITFAVYLSAANLRYFASTWRTRSVYFAAPLALLALALLGYASAVRIPPYGSIFLLFVSAADFVHAARQNFGMLQMFKGQAAWSAPRALRHLENGFFLGMGVLQFETFSLGGLRPQDPLVQASLGVVSLAGLIVLATYGRALLFGEGRRAGVLIALGYFAFQTASAALAVWSYYLYLVTLAMHHVEYHVIMAPRVFHSPLDLRARVDRISALLRRHWIGLYVLLLGVAIALQYGRTFGYSLQPRGEGYLFFAYLVNGLFLIHYFIEAFLWKFSNPHYRRTLTPLYAGSGGLAHSRAR